MRDLLRSGTFNGLCACMLMLLSCRSERTLAAELETLVDRPAAAVKPIDRAVPHVDQSGGYWTVQCDSTDQALITGTYLQFLENYNIGPVKNAADVKGSIIRTWCDVSNMKVLAAPRKGEAFTKNWWAELDLHYEFGFRKSNDFSLSLSGGYASSIDNIQTHAQSVSVRANVYWYAADKKLEVSVWELDNPGFSGPQGQQGKYSVTGRSVTSTFSAKKDVNLAYTVSAKKGADGKGANSQEVSVNGSTYQDAQKNRLRVVMDGLVYHINYGTFHWWQRSRNDGTAIADIVFEAEFFTEAELTALQTAQEKSAECNGTRSFTTTGSFLDIVTGLSLRDSKQVRCGISSNSLPYQVRWNVSPNLDTDRGVDEGQLSQVRWVVDSNSKTSYYQPVFRNGLSWSYQASPAAGGTGPTISATVSASAPKTTLKTYRTTKWK